MESNLSTYPLKNKWFEWALRFTVFSLPIQLSVLAYESVWGRGFLNPYTTIHLNLFDVLLFFTGLFFLLSKRDRSLNTKNDSILLLLLLGVALSILSLLWAPEADCIFSLLISSKLLELIAFYVLLRNSSEPEKIQYWFIFSIILQSILVFFQTLGQHDLGLQVLGETHIDQITAELARFQLFDTSWIRAYGTFPHPNVLGGYLFVGIFFSLLLPENFKREGEILLTIQSLALLLTFSRSAFMAMLLVLLLNSRKIKYKKIIFPLLLLGSTLLLIRGLEFDRLQGYQAAWELIKLHPLGLGFSQFTLYLDQSSLLAIMPWEYQPVHNIYLLLITEWGVASSMLFITAVAVLLIKKYLRPRSISLVLVGLLFIGLFDHYLISLDQGRLLLILILALLPFKMAAQPSKKTVAPK